MITKFNIFESAKVRGRTDERPKVKDYVIARASDTAQNTPMDSYLRTAIGQIIDVRPDSGPREFDYKVYYENVPHDLRRKQSFFPENEKYLTVRWVSYPEILFWSSDKKELIIQLKASRFDL